MAPCSKRADAVEPPLEEGVMAKSLVHTVPAAPSTVALEQLQRELAVEVDAADDHDEMSTGETGIVVVDVRGPVTYQEGHVPGAVRIQYRRHVKAKMGGDEGKT